MSIRSFLTPKSPRRKASPETFEGPSGLSQSSGNLPSLARSGDHPQPPRSPRGVQQQQAQAQTQPPAALGRPQFFFSSAAF